MKLTIKRGIATFAQVEIDEKTVFVKKLMNEHKITTEFYSESALAFQIGDYIEHGGERFTLNRLPEVTKLNLKTFLYKAEFEGPIYNLYSKLFLWEGIADFSYTGTAADFIGLIISNINTIDTGWTAGTIDNSTELTIEFENDSCRVALTRIAEKFGFEFSVISKAINLQKSIGTVTENIFEYGRGKGLYKLERKQISDQNIVTRVFGFGGTTNIPYGYRDRAKRLVFEERYLEKNIGLYGEIEGVFTNNDIYPKRTGTITGVSITFAGEGTVQQFYVEDSTIDFDINDNLIAGETANIVFKSGDLSGYQFEIIKYDHTNKRIYFNPFSETDGYTLPNTLNQPAIGNEYTLTGISMPQSYIDAAEAELKAATQEFIDKNSVPQVVYELEIDQKYIKTNSISLKVGDKVTIKDTDLGIDNLIRISENTYPLVNVNKIKATIADFVPYTIQERIIKTAVQAKKETVFVDRRASELARRNALRQSQFKELLFDPDNYFDPVNIKPQSIDTQYLSVGAKSQDFVLNGVRIQPNYLGNENKIVASAGSLSHLKIEIQGAGNTWVIANELSEDTLVANTAYYLYAKCSKTQLTGVWHISSDQLQSDGEIADPDDHNYYFMIGVLFSVLEGARDFDFSYGMTYINGRIITTGVIRSIDGENYFDLDTNKFRIGDSTSSLDWNVTTPGTLTLKGALVQSASGTTVPIGVFRGAYNASYAYYKGDLVTYNGETWRYIKDTAASGQAPAENTYWTIEAAKGGDGVSGITCYNIASNGYAWRRAINGGSWSPSSNVSTIVFYFYRGTTFLASRTITATLNTSTGNITCAYLSNSGEATSNSFTNNGTPTVTINVNLTSPGVNASQTVTSVEGGLNGNPGADGDDGINGNFTEYQYAKNGSTTTPPSITVTDLNPTGWSTTPPTTSVLEYLWMTKAVKNSTGTTLVSNWTTPVRIKGDTGDPGADGVDGADGADGAAGTNARAVNLTTTALGIAYDTNGANPSPAGATITATALNTTGTVYYQFFKNDVSVQNTTSNTLAYTPPASYGSMPDKIEVQIREGSNSGTILARDQMTIVGLKAGVDSITVVLTNEAHVLAAASDGTVSSYTGSGTDIKAWEGTTPLTVDQNSAYGNSTFRVTGATGSGITPGTASGADGSSVRTYGAHSNMTADNASITYSIVVKNAAGVEFTFTRIQSFSKSKAGTNGSNGADGSAGPSAMYQGVYDAGRTYYGNSTRVDIVQYSGSYYVARIDAGTFSGVTPTNTSKWNGFGATFDSVATQLLFASLAYIDNLGVKYLRTATSGQRVFINGADGSMHFYNSSDVETMKLENGVLTAVGAVLNGCTVKSATTGRRIEIADNEIKIYNSNGDLKAKLSALDTTYGIAELWFSSNAFINQSNIVFNDSNGNTAFQGDPNGAYVKVLQLKDSQTSSFNNSVYVGSDGNLKFKDRNGSVGTIRVDW